ncbi:hypothetical protein KPZU09_48880 [Klebsiella pneumoniae]|uniref:Uncharacterized protein n=1 Tax=Klebsiella pneumoniae TaxID=573 RepID=A0A919M127_KLEPN|nr:hypothetical protein KPZU09_48880 [Klebsiella pneumoniae]
MEDLTVCDFLLRQAVDLIARIVAARIAAGGNHHAQRRAVIPLGGFLVQLARAGGEAQLDQSDFMRSMIGWVSGSPKRQLNSITFGLPCLSIIRPA